MSRRSPRPIRPALIGCLLLAGVLPAAAAVEDPADPTSGFRRALAGADEALDLGESEIAESRYRSALREGWLLLGALAAEEDDLELSRQRFERARDAAADDRRPLIALALLELKAENFGEAASLMRRLAGRDPADAEARQLLARALVADGNLDGAIQELEELQALVPGHLESLFTLATAYLRQGRPEAAEPLFLQLATERPIPETHTLIGRTYRDHGHYERAREALETALELDPRVRRVNYYLGSVDLLSEGRGRLAEAIGHFQAELRVNPGDPTTSLHLGIALVEDRRPEEALPHLELASRSANARRDAFQFLGKAHLALGRTEEAVVAFQRALELAEAEAMARPEGVLVDLGESQLSSLNYQLALALRRLGREEEAKVHFAAAKESSARLAESSREILTRYLANEPREASEGLRQPLALSPLAGLDPQRRRQLESGVRTALARVYLNLGVFKMQAQRFAGAARLFAGGAELDPGFPRIHYSLGVALFNDRRFAEAVAPLERALREQPGDGDLRRMLAVAHLNSDGFERAVELLRDAEERRDDPSLEYAYALALVRSGRAEEAEPVFAGLLAANADWPELNVLLGQAHAQQDDYEAAIRTLERALELEPEVAEAHATLGDIYLRQGRLDEAEAELRAELAAHPGDQRARYTLAVVLDLNRKHDEAKSVLREHLDARPASADGRYLLGKILLAEGAAEEAREQLMVALELAPEDANVRYQLGQALQKLGRREEAAEQFAAFQALKKGEAPVEPQ